MSNLRLLSRKVNWSCFWASISHRATNLAFAVLVSFAIAEPRPVAAQTSLSCGDTRPIVLFPPTHEMVSYNLRDITGVTFDSIYYITQDEPVGWEGFDAAIIGPTSFSVRAERDGYGDGRVYDVIYIVSDERGGNRVLCSLQVHVPHSPNRAVVNSGVQACIGLGCSR